MDHKSIIYFFKIYISNIKYDLHIFNLNIYFKFKT